MLTVAEVPEYIRRAEKLLSADERRDLVRYAERNELAGLVDTLVSVWLAR
jgi:hypothetical protein